MGTIAGTLLSFVFLGGTVWTILILNASWPLWALGFIIAATWTANRAEKTRLNELHRKNTRANDRLR